MGFGAVAEVWILGRGTTLVLAGIAAFLAVGSLERGVRALLRREDPVLRERLRSVAAWWVLFGLFVSVLILGPRGVVVAMAALALFLLRDTLRLARRMSWYPVAALGALVAFLLVWRGGEPFLTTFLPVLGAVLLIGEWLWRRFRSVGGEPVVPACLVGVAGPLYAAGVALLPSLPRWMEGELGWFVLLAVLTELNDAAQAWWGRSIGRHRMTPVLSPRKTWEGLAGGVLTMAAAALVIAPLTTPYGRAVPPGAGGSVPVWVWCGAFALLLGLGGVAGDLSGSWLKRRAGVKDSGHLIPGQGGLLDRLDSLTVTAPVFYLATRWIWFS